MRLDPYQERARALAVEAGLDPDAKIDRPGQRPMPALVHVPRCCPQGTACAGGGGVAADIATKPQAAQYQNSPLKIFGQHEDATIAQMRNCMAVGNAVAGVICADGHLGYAQPVGGVIAYEKQISISGVGFDIGCGNMAVRLDTPFAAIESSVGDDHQGTCTGDFVRRRAHQRGARRARAVRRRRCLARIRHGGVSAEGAWRSSAPSARATTMST